ncbi:hypothetical protein LINPERHAP1_LOCUS14063 [Linum perenne]
MGICLSAQIKAKSQFNC